MPDNKTDSPAISDRDNPEGELIKRRFIAGAVCPACRAEDRIQVEYWRQADGETEVRVCVACEFRESANAEDGAAKSLGSLPRIRRGRQSQTAVAEPVRLLDPGKSTEPPSQA